MSVQKLCSSLTAQAAYNSRAVMHKICDPIFGVRRDRTRAEEAELDDVKRTEDSSLGGGDVAQKHVAMFPGGANPA
jgi:hypothetical protein